MENFLIFGATSDMAKPLIEKLLAFGSSVWAISRSNLECDSENLHKFNFDLTDDEKIREFFSKIKDIKFNSIIVFHGLAISSPVEFLSKDELMRSFSVSIFSMLEILKNAKANCYSNSKIIFVSSMASYGIYPFISPYAISKASSDILLSAFEIESGIRTVSIKAGVAKTKFWEFCIRENERNFENFKGEYENIGKFLKANAKKNSKRGIDPSRVSFLIFKIIKSKNPKSSYNIGIDSYFSLILSLFKGRILYSIIRYVLKNRVKVFLNDK